MTSNHFSALIEYSSLLFVLSFFLFHNIIVVFIGISLSIISINKRVVHVIFYYAMNSLFTNYKQNNCESIALRNDHKDSAPALVDEVEILGFIPSLKNNADV